MTNRAIIMTAIATTALAAILGAAPATAYDPGANPTGEWVCVASGDTEPAGRLTMTETGYAFFPTGAQNASQGGYRFDQNVLTVTSGPLKDELGLGYGYFNTRKSPIALTFNSATGGMICSPETGR